MPRLLRRILAGGRPDGVRQAGPALVAGRLPAESIRSARRVRQAGADRALLSAPTRLDRLGRLGRLAGAGGGAQLPGRGLAARVARVTGVRRLPVGPVLAVVAGLVVIAAIVAGLVLAGPVLVGGGFAGHPGHAVGAVLARLVIAGRAGLVLPAARAAGRGRRPGVVLPRRVLAREAGLILPGSVLVGRVAGRRAEDLRLLGQLGLSLRTAGGNPVGTPVRLARGCARVRGARQGVVGAGAVGS